MTKFDKPGTKEGDYPDWAKEAGEKALADAGIPYDDVEQAYAGYCYGDSTYGQRAVYGLGLTGIPVVNVNNNCSTGSSALFLARQAVRGGLADCALALGFEKMEKGSLGVKYTDRTNPIDKHAMAMFAVREPEAVAAGAADVRQRRPRAHGAVRLEPDHYAWIGWKNHKHSVNNPYAQFQTEYTLDEIKEAQMIHEPLTKLQCSPTSDGSACAIVASERFVDEHDLVGPGDRDRRPGDGHRHRARRSTTTPTASRSSATTCRRQAADQAYEEAGVAPDDVDVFELHDCFSANELITYEALGFADEGEGHKLVEAEATTYGGDGPVVNPSGGLISKGHPLGATGLAQCSELTWQLRGEADARQVEGAKVALQHNIGLGGAAVVTVYRPRTTTSYWQLEEHMSRRQPSRRLHRRAARLRRGDPRLLRARVRHARAARAAHRAADTERHNQELYEKMAELGWLGVSIPEEYGGAGGGVVDLCLLLEETARGLAAGRRLRRHADRRRRLRALRHRGAEAGDPRRHRRRRTSRRSRCPSPRPAPTSAALHCRAERRNGGYVVNGQKTWISDAHVAEHILLVAPHRPREAPSTRA